MDNNWDTDKLEAADLAKAVTTIHLVAYTNENNEGDEDGNPPTNHWCTFLETPDHKSVRLDMAPGYGSDGLRGKIEISSKKYNCTSNNITNVTIRTSLGLTVQKIVDLVSQKGHQKYQFTPEWEGCRYWNYILISDLENAGYIVQGHAKEAFEAMSYYWIHPSGKEAREIKKGTFR